MATDALVLLAVDDHPDNLVALRAVLADALPGAEVLTAASGAEGLLLARSRDPDVVLLDVVMPGMDGYAVCRSLKADETLRATPVLFLTANRTDRESRVRALEAGAEGFLTKPFDEIELIAQIRAMAKIKAANRRQLLERQELSHLVAERTVELERQLAERLRAERALQSERDNLRAFLTAAPVPLLVFDDREEVVHVNRAAVRLFGQSLEALGGKHCGDAIGCARTAAGCGRSCAGCLLAAAVREGLAGRALHDQEHEVELVAVGGVERRSLLVDEEPLTVDGRPGVVLAVNDVTLVRRIQKEREDLRASLAQSDRLASMGMLAAGVAHEINNPLAYVLYNLESLAEDMPEFGRFFRRYRDLAASQLGPEGAAEALGYDLEVLTPAAFDDALARVRDAVAGTQRIKTIVRSLGTFSHVEQGEVAPVSLPACIEHAVTMAANELKYRARLVLDLAPVPVVLATEGKLAQVFLNLLINAAHAIDEGHVEQNEVRARTWAEGDTVFAEVRDTGRGIAPEHHARIFEPFFTTKPVGVGSGLGLSICKRIVCDLGGDLSFQSEPGKGTRFLLRLPRMPEDWAQRARASDASLAKDAASYASPARVRGRILAVDDEPGIRAILTRMLQADHEVVTAISGEAARALLEKDRAFDLIFCDLMMPNLSGMELHAWLAQEDPRLAEQVVFVTGGAFTPGASAYLASAGNLRVEKPFDAKAFKKMTAELVLAARSKRRPQEAG